MLLVDTSFLFAYFFSEDSCHERALEVAHRIKMEELYLIQNVFEEMVTLVGYRTDSKEAVRIGKILLNPSYPFRLMASSDVERQKAWQLFQEFSPHKLSFIDVMLITLAKEYECPIVTFDGEFKRFGVEVVG